MPSWQDIDAESSAELVCRLPSYCPQHAVLGPHKGSVQIKHIDAEAGRWTARGKGICGSPTHDGTPCRNVCITITEHLPIEFQDLPCPNCSKIVKYKYKLECVQINEREFAFAASVTCPHCEGQSVFRKIAKSLRRIKRVKVGPTGLELETHD
jgi:hypothetical protein